MLNAIEDLTQNYTEIDSAIAVGSLMNRRLNETDAKRHNRDYLFPVLDALTDADIAKIRQIALADEDLTKAYCHRPGTWPLPKSNIARPKITKPPACRWRVQFSVCAIAYAPTTRMWASMR